MAKPKCMEAQLPLAATRLYAEGAMSLERELDTYSKLLVACNERVQMMHSPSFNKEQCQYLVDTLKKIIESLSGVFEPSHSALIGSCAPTKMENHLLSFKLLLVLATEIKRFIKGCSQDAWIPVAMTLTNESKFVSFVGFHLELCRVALSENCEASRGLKLDQVVNINKDVIEIVKTKASMDNEDLLRKISLALPSLHGDKKDLVSYLLQRLLRVAPTPNIPLPKSTWVFSQYLTLLKSMFKKIKQGVSIGRGSSATVFKAMWLEMEVAVKVFYGESNPDFLKEVDVLTQLCHPNITSMFCCMQERQKCSIVMELMDGDLQALMQQRLEGNYDSPPFKIWEAIDLMHQIAQGGKYLHEQRVVHRDLKSLNILVKSVKIPDVDLEHVQAKVADFNVSKIKKSSTTHSEQTMNVGSNRWMAPELIQPQSMDNQGSNPTLPKYPYKCDIYSFAMVCYEIMTGKVPFSDYLENESKKMKAMILAGDRPKLPTYCPQELRELIEKCWNQEPKSRPTFDDICQELKFMKYLLMAGRMGKSRDVLVDLDKVDERELNDAFTLSNCGVIEGRVGKGGDALENLNKVDELEPNDAFTLRNRGIVKGKVGEFVDALEDLNKANELKPDDAFTLRNRGIVKGRTGKFVDALEDLNKANELKPNDAFTLKTRGDIKRKMNKFVEALEDLNKADELQPNDAFTLRTRGVVKKRIGKFVDALMDLNKANELKPNDPFTLKSRGDVKRKMSNYTDALEDLNRVDELQPNDAFTLKIRGIVKGEIGKYGDALKDLNKADELEPDNAFTLKYRGDLKRMMGKFVEALEDLNRANEFLPNDPFTLRTRGVVEKRVGKYGDALMDLNKDDELEPTLEEK